MRCAVELANVHHVVFVFQYGGFVVVDIEVIRGTEDGHDAGKAGSACFPIHSVASILSFVSANDREKIVLLEKGAGGRIGEEIGAAPDVVVHKEFRCLLLAELLQWVGPEDIAHEAMSRWLAESINLQESVKTAVNISTWITYAL